MDSLITASELLEVIREYTKAYAYTYKANA